jgi:hypothetical protein
VQQQGVEHTRCIKQLRDDNVMMTEGSAEGATARVQIAAAGRSTSEGHGHVVRCTVGLPPARRAARAPARKTLHCMVLPRPMSTARIPPLPILYILHVGHACSREKAQRVIGQGCR